MTDAILQKAIKITCDCEITHMHEQDVSILNDAQPEKIRIYHECEGKIEKSVLRIALWHHEACRVMTNGDPEGHIFLSYPYT